MDLSPRTMFGGLFCFSGRCRKNSRLLYFEMEDGTSFIVRPSGTEPKVKVYIMVSGKDAAECDAKVKVFTEAANALTK